MAATKKAKTKPQMITDLTNFYTTAEVMAIFGVSSQTITRFIRKKMLVVAGISQATRSKVFDKEKIRYLKPYIKWYHRFFGAKRDVKN